MLFQQVLGHSEIKETLIRATQKDKIPHAMLLSGKEGVGMLPMALALAQYLNCENWGEIDSCGQCNSCSKNSKFIHPDVHFTYPTTGAKTLSREKIEDWRKALAANPYLTHNNWIALIDKENKQGNITAEECNQIIRQLKLRNVEGKYKVQIIWMAEFLKKEGNRLLKIIEEPPSNTVFILIAENMDDILPTILSRTQLVAFKNLPDDLIANHLTSNYETNEIDALKIAQLTEGNVSEAIDFATSGYQPPSQIAYKWLQLVKIKGNQTSNQANTQLVELVDKISTLGRQKQKLLIQYLLFILREFIPASLNLSSKLNEKERQFLKKLFSENVIEEIDIISEHLNNLHYGIVRNANAKVAFLGVSLKIAASLRNEVAM